MRLFTSIPTPTLARVQILTLMASGLLFVGCVSVAEHRKLEERVLAQRRGVQSGDRQSLADLRAEMRGLEERLAILEGRIEEAEHKSKQAIDEARKARREAAGGAGAPRGAEPNRGTDSDGAYGMTPPGAIPDGDRTSPRGSEPSGAAADEIAAYAEARNEWRERRYDRCIDRFSGFLQTYPSSSYADDAAFWLADCHFKRGDYKTAVVRFDDVVARYPRGERSADALYRQGEALLQLGPGYGKAATKAFERVVSEYPDSPRADAAKRQLELLRPR